MDLPRLLAVLDRRGVLGLFPALLLVLTATFPLLHAADLSAIKVVSGDFTPGGRIMYTITVSNDGRTAQADNRGDEMTDRISPHLVGVTATADSGVAEVIGATVTWNGSIPSQGDTLVHIEANIDLGVAPGTMISNQAELMFDSNGDGTNDSSALSGPVAGSEGPTVFTVGAAPQPDLIVDSVTASATTVAPGESFTINATVRNQGDAAANSTTLRYYQSSDPSISTSDSLLGTDSVPSLDPEGSSKESIEVSAPAESGSFWVGACMDAVKGESDTSNNCSAGVELSVISPPVEVDLQIEKECELTGSTVTCTLTASNRSGSDATGVIVRDTISGASFGQTGCLVTASGPSVLEWSITILEAHTFQICTVCAVPAATLSSRGQPAGSALIVNTAEISGDQNDPEPSNNTARATILLPPLGAVLSATQEVSSAVTPEGTIELVYTITVTNQGSGMQSDNPGPEMIEVLSPELRVTAASADNGVVEFEGNTVTWNGSMAPSGVTIVVISAQENRISPVGYSFYSRYSIVHNQAITQFDRDGDGINESFQLSDWSALPGAQDPTIVALQNSTFIFPHVFAFGENFTTISVAKREGADGYRLLLRSVRKRSIYQHARF